MLDALARIALIAIATISLTGGVVLTMHHHALVGGALLGLTVSSINWMIEYAVASRTTRRVG